MFERLNLKWLKHLTHDSLYFCLTLLFCCRTFSLRSRQADPAAERCWNTLSTQSSEWPLACLPNWTFPFFILERKMHWPQQQRRRAKWTHHKHPSVCSLLFSHVHLAARDKGLALDTYLSALFLICWDILKRMAICLNSTDAVVKLSAYFFKC